MAVFASGALPCARAVRYGIVNCDDYDYVRMHKGLPSELSAEGALKSFSGEVAEIHGIWMPLTWISYMADGSIARSLGLGAPDATENGVGAACVMHAHSVLLHGVNAVLLWWLLASLLSAAAEGGGIHGGECGKGAITLAAAAAAAFWAAHPLRVESVVWISSRKDVLSAAWLLAALILWTRRGWRSYALSIACFAAGALAKPSVMSLPALCLTIDMFVRRRICPFRYLLPVAVAVGTGALAAQMQAAGGATNDLADVPLWGRLLNAAAAFGIYLKNTVWPIDLAVQCMHRWPALPRFVWPGLALSAAAAFWLGRGLLETWDRRREWFARDAGAVLPEYAFVPAARPVFAGCLWFAVSVAPMLGLANFGYHAFADRFTYIPAMGLSLAAGAALAAVARKRGIVLTPCCVAAVLAEGMLSWRQAGFWRSDRTLWERTLEIDGEGSAVAHASLALYHFEFTHDLDECIRHYRRAFELKPMFVEGTRHLYQFALCEKGLVDEAGRELEAAKEWSTQQNDIVESKASRMDMSVERRLLPPYELSRIAYFIVAPGMLKAAEDELCAMSEAKRGNVNVQYLMARLAEVKGERSRAEEIFRKIVSDGSGSDYVRFRYLAGGRGTERKKVEK